MTEKTGATDAAPTTDESPADGEAPAPAEGPPAASSTFRDLPPVTERDLAARARGLSSAYIEGGEDPDLAETRRLEARYRRLLIGMIVLIVGLGLVVTIVGLFVPGVG
ncbi:MAG: hypothetical protein ACHQ3P_05750 [Candidatus Limnocylindrales bacterium]